MTTTSFILALLLLQPNNAQILLTKKYNPPECTINSSEFWGVCETHFLLVHFLTILVLQTEQHYFDLNHFTEDLLRDMNGYEFPVTLNIQEYFLSGPNEYQTSRNFDESIVDEIGGQNVQPVEYETLAKIKKLSSDSPKGYFIIVWDVATLHRFLDDDYQIVIPDARATYSLHFVFTSSESCPVVKYELRGILRRFWIDYGVVNVIAQTPCSCDHLQVYIYRPFVRSNSSWGVTNIYTLQEINNNFRLITNLLDNLNGVPLSIAVFPRSPTAIRDLPKLLKHNPIYKNITWSKGFVGKDGMILGTLAESLNFDVVLIGDQKRNFGLVYPNGTISGVLCDVAERRAVFAANSRLLANHLTDHVEFTKASSADTLCIVVPKATKIPKWASISKSFTPMTWFLISLTCIACTIFWCWMGSSETVAKASWIVFSILVGAPIKVVPNLGQSFFLIACMVFNIIIIGVIQGSLFTNFSTTMFYADINTLQELDESELPIAMGYWNFIKADSNLLRSLENKTVYKSHDSLDVVAYQRNLSSCESKLYTEFLMKMKYVDQDGLPLLHILLNECLNTFVLANIVPKGSAFLTVFDNVITKTVESGLTIKWNNDVVDSLTIEKMINLNRNRTSLKSFSIYDVQSAFYIIVLGYISSFLLFLCEVLCKNK
jgi:hypothetical protein